MEVIVADSLGLEPSEKFLAEFPYGHVPIKHAFGWPGCETAWEWFNRAHEALDVIESLTCSVDDLFEWSHQFHQAPTYDPTKTDERRPWVALMMQGGLTLRQIARWLEIPEDEAVRHAIGKHMGGTGNYRDVLEADELLWSGRYASNHIENVTGLNRRTVYRLRALRQGEA